MPSTMSESTTRFTVAIEGFSAFERSALASFFRLATGSAGAYHRVDDIEHADLVIADADHRPVLERIARDGRLRDTVFIGGQPPAGALAWMSRPIVPNRIVRELDALVANRQAAFEPPPEPLAARELDLLDAPADEGAALRRHGRLALVVEDSGIARKFLAMRLERAGYTVHAARSGELAIELVRHHAYAVVCVDVVLGPPGSIDGLRVCQYIKQRTDTPGGVRPGVLVVTGLAGPMDKVRGQLAGCDAWLTKPLNDDEFVAALRRFDPTIVIA